MSRWINVTRTASLQVSAQYHYQCIEAQLTKIPGEAASTAEAVATDANLNSVFHNTGLASFVTAKDDPPLGLEDAATVVKAILGAVYRDRGMEALRRAESALGVISSAKKPRHPLSSDTPEDSGKRFFLFERPTEPCEAREEEPLDCGPFNRWYEQARQRKKQSDESK